MGFFSNLIKKVGKFVASVFRDVEKPVKKAEKKAEDTALKAFREFQEFIEAPIEEVEKVIEEEPEEPEEVEEEIIRKIVKTTAYSSGRKDTLYALTYENNTINRFNELRDKIFDEFDDSHGLQEKFGYDDEYVSYAEFEYPEIEVGFE